MIIPESDVPRLVSVPLPAAEINRIYDFLQGAVDRWCKEKEQNWFALRDLTGGGNFYWEGTPLLPLYQRHITRGFLPIKAGEETGKDTGKLLAHVIQNDKRDFNTKIFAMTRKYKWIPKDESIDSDFKAAKDMAGNPRGDKFSQR